MKKQPKRLLLSELGKEPLTAIRGGEDPATPPPPPEGGGKSDGYFGSGH